MTLTFHEDGFYIFYIGNGQSVVGKVENGKLYGANVDCVDPVGWKKPLTVREDHVAAIEHISEDRFLYLREMSIRRVRTQDIQTTVQLLQAVEMGKQAGIMNDDANPPKANGEASKGPKLVEEPKEPESLGDPVDSIPPASMPIAPKMVGVVPSQEKPDYDGVVIDLPAPGGK